MIIRIPTKKKKKKTLVIRKHGKKIVSTITVPKLCKNKRKASKEAKQELDQEESREKMTNSWNNKKITSSKIGMVNVVKDKDIITPKGKIIERLRNNLRD